MKKASSILISIMLVLMLSVAFVGCDLLGLFQDDDSDDISDDDNQTVYIEINDVEELKGLANQSGNYKLVDDIDISDDEWEPIEGFSGLLEGNNKTISGLTIDNNDENLGLFATLEGTVQNMKLTEVDIVASGAMGTIGALCGTNEGVINNVSVEGTIDAPYYENVGGIAGQSSSVSIVDCKNLATISGYNYVGGIVGYLNYHDDATFVDNTNEGAISGNEYVGGIIGLVKITGNVGGDTNLSIKTCSNNGEVSGKGNSVGGIVGGAIGKYNWGDHTISVVSCANNNSVSGYDNTAGIVGYGEYLYEVNACSNNADISGNNYVGGYVGKAGTYTVVSRSENNNKISGKAYVGGIAGKAGKLINCTNNGEIVSNGVLIEDSTPVSCVGGIVGWAQSIEKCTNNADISVTEGYYVGGIVGFIGLESEDHAVQQCKNNGNVHGNSYVGGIIGCIRNMGNEGGDTTNDVISNENNGFISGSGVNPHLGDGHYVGGIVGGAYGKYNCGDHTITISGCKNNNHVGGSSYVGGILGYGVYVVEDESIWATNVNLGATSGANKGDKYGYIE